MQAVLYKNKYLVYPNGDIFNAKTNHKMVGNIERNGYRRITLLVDGMQTKESVHRIVCKCFIQNPQNKPQVNHKNGIKTDNRVENLEWATSSENQQHSIRNGLRKSSQYQKDVASEYMGTLVLDLNTGIFYSSIVRAAKAKLIPYHRLKHQLHGKWENKSGMIIA